MSVDVIFLFVFDVVLVFRCCYFSHCCCWSSFLNCFGVVVAFLLVFVVVVVVVVVRLGWARAQTNRGNNC